MSATLNICHLLMHIIQELIVQNYLSRRAYILAYAVLQDWDSSTTSKTSSGPKMAANNNGTDSPRVDRRLVIKPTVDIASHLYSES